MLLPIIFMIRGGREKLFMLWWKLTTNTNLRNPNIPSWPWSRQLLLFKEVESFVIYMFDYFEICHKRICILSRSSNTKGVNIHVQNKFRITLPWPEVRNSFEFVGTVLFNTCLSLCLLLWPKHFLPRSKEFNWSYVLWSHVQLIRLNTKLNVAQESSTLGLAGITNVTLKWLRIFILSILCQYAQWQIISLKITVNNAKGMQTYGKEWFYFPSRNIIFEEEIY